MEDYISDRLHAVCPRILSRSLLKSTVWCFAWLKCGKRFFWICKILAVPREPIQRPENFIIKCPSRVKIMEQRPLCTRREPHNLRPAIEESFRSRYTLLSTWTSERVIEAPTVSYIKLMRHLYVVPLAASVHIQYVRYEIIFTDDPFMKFCNYFSSLKTWMEQLRWCDYDFWSKWSMIFGIAVVEYAHWGSLTVIWKYFKFSISPQGSGRLTFTISYILSDELLHGQSLLTSSSYCHYISWRINNDWLLLKKNRKKSHWS